MPRETFGIPSNNHSDNKSTSWGVLEQRTSGQNCEKMTCPTKSKTKLPATIHYDNDNSEDIGQILVCQLVAVASE